MFRRLGWIFLVAGCSFSGGLLGFWLLGKSPFPLYAQGPSGNTPIVTDLVQISERFELVARKVSPAVVYVEARKPGERAGKSEKRMVEESGSGVIVQWPGRREYMVLTNNHVVAGTEPRQIVIHLADGRILQPSRVLADPETDVAVLVLSESGPLPAAPLGNSDRMQVGHWVLAIGSPYGLNQTVTHGIISAKQRSQISLGSTIRIKDFLQTDAAINPGSSGGPLVNLNGEIVGINTAIASPNGSNSGIAFSIPINLARRVVDQLLERGTVSRGYLGIQLAPGLEPGEALKRGLDNALGAFIEAVYPNTPGAAAGLQVGDQVIAVDDVTIRNENHLINLISSTPPGKTVVLKIVRNGKRLEIPVTVGDWAEGQSRLRSP
ncbi:MAG: trypsin-like peptidase domain-containing protein [Gemmatales bacterium]|nr:trypsin-like peptidase domain-containing protein [Gemmatales bacterium]MDW8388202.1 trypsin-like peptidase domain-containing protein [Gemmatales bacterium]